MSRIPIHLFLDRTPIGGFNGYAYLAPVGAQPPLPNRRGPRSLPMRKKNCSNRYFPGMNRLVVLACYTRALCWRLLRGE